MNGMAIRLSPTVKIIAIACFAGFIIQQTADQFLGMHLLANFALVPAGFIIDHKFWQLFTYPFLHGDVLHLCLNLLMLVFIGSDLEFLWGRKKFTLFYFACSTAGGVLYLLLQAWVWGGDGIHTPMVGASGALYGLLMAYGVIYGERVMLFMMIFPMKAKHFIWILALVEFMTTVFSGRAGLASAAHVGGMLMGLALLWIEKNRKRRGGFSQFPVFSRPAKKKHLKLVIDNEPEDRDAGPKTWH